MPCKTPRQGRFPKTVPRLVAPGCLFVLILISVRPPDGRGEEAPAAPQPPDVVWEARVHPANPEPAADPSPDPWRPRGSQPSPAADSGPIAPRLDGDSRSESPTIAPTEGGDVLWTPRKTVAPPPPPPKTEAPPLLPPPRSLGKADDAPAAPDDDRAVLLGAAQRRPAAEVGCGPCTV